MPVLVALAVVVMFPVPVVIVTAMEVVTVEIMMTMAWAAERVLIHNRRAINIGFVIKVKTAVSGGTGPVAIKMLLCCRND